MFTFVGVTEDDQKEARDWLAYLCEQRIKQQVERLENEAQSYLHLPYPHFLVEG